jgi:hypothetical protein
MQNIAKAQRRFHGDIAYMSAITTAIGNKSDVELRDSADCLAIAHKPPHTLPDLLTILKGNPYFGMFQTTAGHICGYLDLPIEQVSLDAVMVLSDRMPSFKFYSEQRRFKRNAVRSYCNFASMLLREARILGWRPRETKASREWQPIIAGLGKARGCRQIARYAIRQEKQPFEFSDDDLNAFADDKLNQGGSYVTRRSFTFLSQLGERHP